MEMGYTKQPKPKLDGTVTIVRFYTRRTRAKQTRTPEMHVAQQRREPRTIDVSCDICSTVSQLQKNPDIGITYYIPSSTVHDVAVNSCSTVKNYTAH